MFFLVPAYGRIDEFKIQIFVLSLYNSDSFLGDKSFMQVEDRGKNKCLRFRHDQKWKFYKLFLFIFTFFDFPKPLIIMHPNRLKKSLTLFKKSGLNVMAFELIIAKLSSPIFRNDKSATTKLSISLRA